MSPANYWRRYGVQRAIRAGRLFRPLWTRADRREFSAGESVMTHDWPECGPGSINVEEMYQAFKARFIDESSNDGEPK